VATDKTLQAKIDRVVKEKINIVPYNPKWSNSFQKEATFLTKSFPHIIKRIEHFGSTAIPGLSAKPIVDLLVEITSFKEVKTEIVPVLENLSYDYFWRPEFDKPPYYSWFIKRNKHGHRTHHIHMVKNNSSLWDRLYFRDYLKLKPNLAKQYETIKIESLKKYSHNREAYTKAKTDFITKTTIEAKKYFNK
jgi:GrpB-like predicted nucleotidyltransferase (UPF0157 family)